MLIALKISNFRSFAAERELSCVASADRAHETTQCIRTGIKALPRIARAALIFGPNGSGKSNLISALATLKDLVRHSDTLDHAQFAERYAPFRLDRLSNQPTRLSIDVLLEGVRYRYSLAYNAERVTHEQLLVYRTGKAQRWFLRVFDESRQLEAWAPFSPHLTGSREVLRRATHPTALFLSTAARLHSEQLRPLYAWFDTGMEILAAQATADQGKIAGYIEDPALKLRMLELLSAADISVADMRVAAPSAAQSAGRSARGELHTGPHIEFLHTGEQPAWLGADMEAAGTLRLVGMLGSILRARDAGRLLVFDDFDNGLHPVLARFLVQSVYELAAGTQTQVILTTHNASLMDLDIARRDEIWLTALDSEHASTLTPLSKQNPRMREVIGRAYLRGRYGAIPDIRTAAGKGSHPISADGARTRKVS